jgi:hypothetical protein
MFSPNDKLLITGTSTRSNDDNGKLVVFERESLKKLHEIVIGESVCDFNMRFFKKKKENKA